MEQFSFLEWYRHFLAVNQIRINEIKHLFGTILLFMCAGGIERHTFKYLNFKNTYSIILYYLCIGTIGVIFFHKLA
jgi:hypothetical protein